MLNVQTFQGAQLRFAKYYLEKLHSFKEHYQRGGEQSFIALTQSDYDWEQIQQARLWTVENQSDNHEIKNLCSSYAIAGAEILHFQEIPIYRLQWFGDALNAARQTGELTAIVHHLLYLGMTYYDLGQLNEAEQYIENALAQVDEPMPDLKAQILCQLGKVQSDSGKINEAYANLIECLNLFKQLGNNNGIAKTLHYLGIILGKFARFDEAQAHYQESLNIYENNSQRLATTGPMLELARLHLLQNEPDRALTFLEKVLAIRREFKYQQAIADTLKNIGYIYYVNEDFATAEAYYEEAIQITRQGGNFLKIADIYGYMGDLRYEQARYEEALNYYQEKLTACQEVKQPFGEMQTIGSIAATYHKLGNFELAVDAFIESLEIAIKYNSPPFILDLLTWTAEFLAEVNRSDLAHHIATFLVEYDLSLEYVQLAAQDILDELAPYTEPIKPTPADHIVLANDIIDALRRIKIDA